MLTGLCQDQEINRGSRLETGLGPELDLWREEQMIASSLARRMSELELPQMLPQADEVKLKEK